MQIQIKHNQDKKGKDRIRGDCVYMDTKFIFTIHAATKREYKFVLTVNLISPATGNILQKTGKPRNDFKKKLDAKFLDLAKKEEAPNLSPDDVEKLAKERKLLEEKRNRFNAGLSLDELNATASAYLHDTTKTTIEKHVKSLVQKLYGDNRDDIFKCLNLADGMGELHARTAYDMFQNDFFRFLRAVSRQVLSEKKNALKRFCNSLEKPISSLTDADIRKAIVGLTATDRKHLRMIEKFFDFAGKSRAYNGVNPVTRCRTNNNFPGKDSNGSHSSEMILTHLSPSVDRKLHDLINEQLETDDMCLAIPLAKGFRMPIARILEITWKDVIIIDNEVLIQDYNKTYAGGTHNYLRPPLRETANFIIARYHFLLKKENKSQLKTMPLVSIPGETVAKKKAALSKYFRTMLQDAGISAGQISTAVDPNNPKAAGGAGYTLLCKHYDHTLKDVCGVDLDSGVGCFLRSLRIHDTTTDYYRCLSDKTGNHFLEVITRRDGYREILLDGHPAKISSKLNDDKTVRTTTVASGGPKLITGVLTRKKIFLPAGSKLVFSAGEGVRGTVCFTTEHDEEMSAEYTPLY
ncbi:MAG: hypothetical protein ACI3W5_12720 [Faecousia sp.]